MSHGSDLIASILAGGGHAAGSGRTGRYWCRHHKAVRRRRCAVRVVVQHETTLGGPATIMHAHPASLCGMAVVQWQTAASKLLHI